MDNLFSQESKAFLKMVTLNDSSTELSLVRAQLHDLLSEANHNQEILYRHQELDLKLIGSHSFRELIDHILNTLSDNCRLNQVTLCLLDQHDELKTMLADLKIDSLEFSRLAFVATNTELYQQVAPLKTAILGKYQAHLHGELFESCSEKPQCVAIIPLIRQSKLLGCLNLGSMDLDRFTDDMGTDFIDRLGSIISICLENVINSERLTLISLTDALTKVNNRRYVEMRMLEEIGRARRQQYSIACMYLDIDFFKKVNDTYGHQSGDDVLKEVAKRIKAELRLSDTLGRFGGEEFVVLLVNTNHLNAVLVAERIRRSIADKPFLLTTSGVCSVTISIGITTLVENLNQGDIDDTARALLQQADHALYQAKEQGRNRVCQVN
jgi:two-component system cell cycle response regulator